ncbi:penicillin-binding transpeptidase domain-containing protein [Cellvibrio sp. NN19]|uniref:penicillin-binding transpeptidase domain-containing protein n=1 Tax=Cellvibrio chitinivorans TaxID=3102792 RepID=UPI002B40BB9D|nr:penicillin-binding transpeptidase domain-containing protein [Cellvibrio sp. NN19]
MNAQLLIGFLVFLPMLAFADICKTSSEIDTVPYTAEMGTNKVTFLAVNLKTHACHVINKTGLDERHTPFSSFKIPHTLIALETGAAKSVDEKIVWDSQKRPAKDFWPATWKQDQTLASAFKHSAAWYYQELVPRISPEQYKKWLSQFNYGNQNFAPPSDTFWLDGQLKVSPKEQVNFVVCLLKDRCGVSAVNFAAFEQIALQETKDNLSLYAKTGAGPIDSSNFDGAFEGWYVGYVKNQNAKPVAAFAIYVEAESFTAIKSFRRDFSLKLLTNLELWAN